MMSTRAMYTFKDQYDTVHVYKHQDGYPEGGLSWIANARNYAWTLPRFEADEFAAAFVAANKPKYNADAEYPDLATGGGVRLCGFNIKEPWQMASDAEYHYIVTAHEGQIHVEIFEVDWWNNDRRTSKRVFRGLLTWALKKYKAEWAEPVSSEAA